MAVHHYDYRERRYLQEVERKAAAFDWLEKRSTMLEIYPDGKAAGWTVENAAGRVFEAGSLLQAIEQAMAKEK